MIDDTPRATKKNGDGFYSKVRKGILPRYTLVKDPNDENKMERKADKRGKLKRTFRLISTLKLLRSE